MYAVNGSNLIMVLSGCVLVQMLQVINFHHTVNTVNGFPAGIQIIRMKGKVLYSAEYKGEQMDVHTVLAVLIGLFLLTGHGIGLNQNGFPLKRIVVWVQKFLQRVDHCRDLIAQKVHTGF